MSDYRTIAETEAYEVGMLHNQLIAACRCGAGTTWPNVRLGRAFAAAWEIQHQRCAAARAARAAALTEYKRKVEAQAAPAKEVEPDPPYTCECCKAKA